MKSRNAPRSERCSTLGSTNVVTERFWLESIARSRVSPIRPTRFRRRSSRCTYSGFAWRGLAFSSVWVRAPGNRLMLLATSSITPSRVASSSGVANRACTWVVALMLWTRQPSKVELSTETVPRDRPAEKPTMPCSR